ncbi:uncharacterized protein [Apostichopus japonicus]|uniref:uncharacterized protein n=1 Tax=Stichopus japonicus TaxID=307972 RepID=UPI003AB59BDE
MHYIVLITLAFIAFQEVSSLQCYSCSDCRDGYDNVKNIQECSILDTFCFKEIEDDGDVNRGCMNQLFCTAKEAIPGKCVHEEVKPCYTCCPEGKCNSASTKSLSVLSSIFTIIACLLFSYN